MTLTWGKISVRSTDLINFLHDIHLFLKNMTPNQVQFIIPEF
jgi:hypothetical protein